MKQQKETKILNVEGKEVEYISNGLLADYLHDIRHWKNLSPEQEVAIWNNRTPANLELMINSHLRLVISIVLKLTPKSFKREREDDFMDLVQAGNIGLIKAIQNFNPNMDVKFSTYAYDWIKAYVKNELAKQRCGLIKKPKSVLKYFSVISKVENRFVMAFGRYPTDDELLVILEGAMPEDKIEEAVQQHKTSTISLDSSVHTGPNVIDGRKLEDIIPDEDDFAEGVETLDRASQIRKVLGKVLKPRLYLLVCARYGLGEFEGTPMKLEEIAQLFVDKGFNENLITTERVRQLEAMAIEKLKKNPKVLKLFMNI